MDEPAITDEELTAYLDGELETVARAQIDHALRRRPDLGRRLAALKAGERPFRHAFDVLLEDAPTDRLQTMLQRVSAPGSIAPQPALRTAGSWRRAFLPAVLAAAFLTGIAFDRLISGGSETHSAFDRDRGFPQAEAEEWRDAVVADLSLFTRTGLADIPDLPATGARELGLLARSLGIALQPAQVALVGTQLKRAELLQYDGKPLGQILYLDPEQGPLALCILQSEEADSQLRVEERDGFSVAFWADGEFSYLLAGRIGFEELRSLAMSLVSRLNGGTARAG